MATRSDHPIPLDTSVAAHERQVAAWIAMGTEQRARLAASMSDDVRRVAAEGEKARKPGPETGAARSK